MALVLALAFGATGRAAAQGAQAHEGFWIGFGFGYGSAEVSCNGCGASDRQGGAAMFLAMGGTVSQKLLLGGELNGWGKWGSAVDDGGLILGNTSFVAYYYPGATSGLFIKGGIGLASYVSIDSSGTTTSGNGFGGVVGVGYDIPVGRTVSLTPVASFRFGSIGTISNDAASFPVGLDQNVVDVGLGITWH
ncbi:MAG TPA: hypothetical protein PKA66_03330 [Gemmatimonadales bacterium]|nr:hypothetical protein [Gemmatimonadales bacterium]